MTVAFQNEGEESIAGGAYKRNVKEAPLTLAFALCPLTLAFNGPLWWC